MLLTRNSGRKGKHFLFDRQANVTENVWNAWAADIATGHQEYFFGYLNKMDSKAKSPMQKG